MRHIIVTRVSVGLTVLFVCAAGAFTLVVRSRHPDRVTSPASAPGSGDAARAARADAAPPETSPSGDAVFAARCGGCHAAADLLGQVREDRAGVTHFLRTHGEAAPEENRLILDYLASR